MNTITPSSQPLENGISFKDMIIFVSYSKNETTHTTWFEYLCFIDGKQVLEIGAMKQYDPEELYDMYLKSEKDKSDRETRIDETNKMAMKDKARFMRSYILDYIRIDEWQYKAIDISALREQYPDVDIYLDSMIHSAADWQWIDYEDAIDKFFILDEQAKKHIKTAWVEWLDMSLEELAERVGDLYYDALAAVLSKMSEALNNESKRHSELENPIKLDTITLKVSQNLQEASINIMTAWEICKPFLKAPLNPKHTTDIQGIPNAILGERIWKLNYWRLAQFLELLAQKLHKDWLADEWRGRRKLSNALFGASTFLKDSYSVLSQIWNLTHS